MTESISSKTVLILGAGASWNCNFPLGTELIDKIITEHSRTEFPLVIRRILFNGREYIKQNGLINQLPPPIANALTHAKIQTFIQLPMDEFKKWTDELGPFRSIDEFISYRKEFSLLAKLSILLILSQSESPGFFENKHLVDINNKQYKGPERTWYNSLWWNLLKRDTNFEELKQILKTIHIITFNYDRSLDYFLLDAIKKFFPDSEKDYTDLPITHVYGSIGSLDKSSPIHNPYRQVYYRAGTEIPERFRMPSATIFDSFSSDESYRQNYDIHLIKMANAILTYGANYPAAKAEYIQDLIINAQNTYVFGFSFFEQNMKILFKDAPKPAANKVARGSLDGTCYKLPSEQMFDLRVFFAKYFGVIPSFLEDSRKSKTISDFFADYSIKI